MLKRLEKSEEYHFIFNNIIDLCNGKNITVSNVMGSFATSKSAMPAWKKGNIPPDTLLKLAEFFGVSVDYLITGKEPETKLTENEQDLLDIFRTLDNREQLKLIGRLQEMYKFEASSEIVGIKVARTTDKIPVRKEVTSEELKIIETLPEETDF
ncbi:MAG: helix-turn-helix domain-containing protein [Ruminococcus sp.]|nr:helix-turn-helix domain-containing protein [Ruminococcus sp.]